MMTFLSLSSARNLLANETSDGNESAEKDVIGVILVASFIILLIVSILGCLHERRIFQCCPDMRTGCHQTDGVKYHRIWIFALQIWDLFSDIYFAYRLTYLRLFINDYEFDNNNNTFVWIQVLSYISPLFILIPYSVNIYAAITLYRNMEMNNMARIYFEHRLLFFGFLVLISGGVSASMSLVCCKLFGLQLFDCGLSKRELIQLTNKLQITHSVCLENIPQLIIQILYVLKVFPEIDNTGNQGSDTDPAVILAFIASFLSVLTAIFAYIFSKQIDFDNQLFITLNVSFSKKNITVFGIDLKRCILKMGLRERLAKRISRALYVRYQKIEIFSIIPTKDGCVIHFGYIMDSFHNRHRLTTITNTNNTTTDNETELQTGAIVFSNSNNNPTNTKTKTTNNAIAEKENPNKENETIEQELQMTSRNKSSNSDYGARKRSTTGTNTGRRSRRGTVSNTRATCFNLHETKHLVFKKLYQACKDPQSIPNAIRSTWGLSRSPTVTIIDECFIEYDIVSMNNWSDSNTNSKLSKGIDSSKTNSNSHSRSGNNQMTIIKNVPKLTSLKSAVVFRAVSYAPDVSFVPGLNTYQTMTNIFPLTEKELDDVVNGVPLDYSVAAGSGGGGGIGTEIPVQYSDWTNISPNIGDNGDDERDVMKQNGIINSIIHEVNTGGAGDGGTSIEGDDNLPVQTPEATHKYSIGSGKLQPFTANNSIDMTNVGSNAGNTSYTSSIKSTFSKLAGDQDNELMSTQIVNGITNETNDYHFGGGVSINTEIIGEIKEKKENGIEYARAIGMVNKQVKQPPLQSPKNMKSVSDTVHKNNVNKRNYTTPYASAAQSFTTLMVSSASMPAQNKRLEAQTLATEMKTKPSSSDTSRITTTKNTDSTKSTKRGRSTATQSANSSSGGQNINTTKLHQNQSLHVKHPSKSTDLNSIHESINGTSSTKAIAAKRMSETHTNNCSLGSNHSAPNRNRAHAAKLRQKNSIRLLDGLPMAFINGSRATNQQVGTATINYNITPDSGRRHHTAFPFNNMIGINGNYNYGGLFHPNNGINSNVNLLQREIRMLKNENRKLVQNFETLVSKFYRPLLNKHIEHHVTIESSLKKYGHNNNQMGDNFVLYKPTSTDIDATTNNNNSKNGYSYDSNYNNNQNENDINRNSMLIKMHAHINEKREMNDLKEAWNRSSLMIPQMPNEDMDDGNNCNITDEKVNENSKPGHELFVSISQMSVPLGFNGTTAGATSINSIQVDGDIDVQEPTSWHD